MQNNITMRFKHVVLLLCVCLVLLSVTACTDNKSDVNNNEQNLVGESLACFTYDDSGHIIQGYYASQDGVNYLFVPSTQAMSDVTIHLGDIAISGASEGVYDAVSGTVAGAFAHSGDRVEITGADGTVYTVAAMQSTLPSVYIDLQDTTLADIHADKDAKHKGNSIYISTLDGQYDLAVEDSVEIKGRGNSTWRSYEKKPYQIKFDDKTSVLGMGEAKKWILLANAADDSMMRSQLIYKTADQMDMGYVTSFEYVDLWIEGDYRGTFMLGEKVEPGSARLQLANDTGALFEYDMGFYAEEDHWFYSEALQQYFALKEIVDESDDSIAAALEDFTASVDEFGTYLAATPSTDVTLDALAKMIDVDSFAKYYIVNEYPLNRESFNSSFYWYKDGADDVIHIGPIWDFDTCMGNDGLSYNEVYGSTYGLFQSLLAIPEFHQRTQELYQVYKDELAEMPAMANDIRTQIADSAAMNYIRWNTLGTINPKYEAKFHDTFDEAVDAVQEWLKGREKAFKVVQSEPKYVYHLYSSNLKEDFYTCNVDERDSLIRAGWDDKGVAWQAPYLAKQSVHRLYNSKSNIHHFTSDMTEVDALKADAWTYEGVVWYTLDTGAPVYRLYNADIKNGRYQYVVEQAEIAALTAKGWTNQGIAWYGVE